MKPRAVFNRRGEKIVPDVDGLYILNINLFVKCFFLFIFFPYKMFIKSFFPPFSLVIVFWSLLIPLRGEIRRTRYVLLLSL